MSLSIFPITLMSSITGGPGFSTDIIVGANGREVRNANWQDPLWKWDLSATVKTKTDAINLHRMFLTHRGRETAFLIQDPYDYKISDDGTTFQSIGTGNGSRTQFQIFKRYTDSAGNTIDRNIYRPDISGLVVKKNGVVVERPADFNVSDTTGVITFTSPPANGHAIAITLQKFYVLARFGIDEFPTQILMWNTNTDYTQLQLPAIPVVEVRE
jgi:uncharacterized protein (TIGR02217 family)